MLSTATGSTSRVVLLLLLGTALYGQPAFHEGAFYVRLADSCRFSLQHYLATAPAGRTAPDLVIQQPFTGLSEALSKTYKVTVPPQHADSIFHLFQAFPFVNYIERIPIDYVFYTPNDLRQQQYSLILIRALKAWDITKGDTSITVAVVDNAVRITHEDLAPNLWLNHAEINGLPLIDDDLNGYIDDFHGYDVADFNNDPNPPPDTENTSPFVHGTHVAGIVSAATDNDLGIASLGFNLRLMSVKATPDTADGSYLTTGYEGILYAARSGANIINMSWGSQEFSQTNQEFITAIANTGVVLIAAAGNNGKEQAFYPAAYDRVMAVGNSNQEDMKATNSNYGAFIDVMAPGTSILGPIGGDDISYAFLGGTSMAAPHVAALAGLVLSLQPELTPEEVKEDIVKGCDNIDLKNPDFSEKLGAGRINAWNTLSRAVGRGFDGNFNPLLIYPNPARDDHVTVEIDAPPLLLESVRLYDLTGKFVTQATFPITESASFSFDTFLRSGTYILEATTQTGHRFRRLWNVAK